MVRFFFCLVGICGENKGADLRLCFTICKRQVFSWLRPDMTEKLFTGTLSKNETKQRTAHIKHYCTVKPVLSNHPFS